MTPGPGVNGGGKTRGDDPDTRGKQQWKQHGGKQNQLHPAKTRHVSLEDGAGRIGDSFLSSPTMGRCRVVIPNRTCKDRKRPDLSVYCHFDRGRTRGTRGRTILNGRQAGNTVGGLAVPIGKRVLSLPFSTFSFVDFTLVRCRKVQLAVLMS